jgi:hypothetical protein
MATKFGLQTWPDNIFPRHLSLNGTIFEGWSRVSNVHEGILNHRQVAFFDLFKRQRKSGWSRTIFAIKTDKAVLEGKMPGLEVHQANGWQLCYHSLGFLHSEKLMDSSEIEELLNAIAENEAKTH